MQMAHTPVGVTVHSPVCCGMAINTVLLFSPHTCTLYVLFFAELYFAVSYECHMLVFANNMFCASDSFTTHV